MFFDDVSRIKDIAARCGTSIFVLPDDVYFELKNAIIVQPEKKSVITIEQIRDLLNRIKVKFSTDQYVIIRPADTLNIEASNALLKTLEEPGDKLHFILVTSQPSMLPSTILSRAALYFLRTSVDYDLISSSEKTKDYAKRLIAGNGLDVLDVTEAITKKKDGVRALGLEVLTTAIEMAYKSYYLTKKPIFLKKLDRLLLAYDGVSRNGHIKLQIIANLL